MIFNAKVKMVGKKDNSYVDEETGKLKKDFMQIFLKTTEVSSTLYMWFQKMCSIC